MALFALLLHISKTRIQYFLSPTVQDVTSTKFPCFQVGKLSNRETVFTCVGYSGAAARVEAHALSVAQRGEAKECQELRPHRRFCYPGNQVTKC